MTRYTLEQKRSWPPDQQVCYGCHKMLPYFEFGKDVNQWNGLSKRCKPCRKVYSKYHYSKWHKNNPEMRMFLTARSRAHKKKIPFTITVEDIVIPEYCPVLGIKLERNGGKNNPATPSLDKFIPAKGYVPENIHVISWRANWIKQDSTVDEIERLALWMRKTT